MGRPMGLDFGLNGDGKFCKRNFRWLFRVDGIIADPQQSMSTLPPLQSARPNLTFKEMTAKHLIEDAYFPAKPDWKPINIVLYDIKLREHPIFEKWINEFYDPEKGSLFAPNETEGPNVGFIRTCYLELYDGCGTTVESWVYEDAWPQSINFQTLDMGDSGIVTCDLTLRYQRAWILKSPPIEAVDGESGGVGNVA